MSQLYDKLAKGIFWTALSKGGDQGVNFIVSVILARILSPEEFGLLAIVMVVVGLSITFVDVGLGAALIQRKEIDASDTTTVFCANTVLALALVGGIWFGAPAFAEFYEVEGLVDLLRCSSIAVLFTALGRVHRALLVRSLKFDRLFKLTFPCTITSGSVGILLALNGWGVWALIARVVLQQALVSASLTMYSSYSLSGRFSIMRLKQLLPYGSRLAVAGLLNRGFTEIYTVVISRSYGVIDVALFQRAKSIRALGAQNMSLIFEQALFPAYASIQDDTERLKRVFEKSLSKIALLGCILMGILAGVAEPLVLVLLGNEWAQAGLYLQILCISGALYPVHASNLSVLKATGNSKLFLRLEVFKKVVSLLILFFTVSLGVEAIIWGQVLGSFIALWINSYYNRKLLGVRYSFQLRTISTALLAGLSVALSAMFACLFIPSSPFYSLILGVFLSLLVSVGLVYLFRSQLQEEVNLCAQLIRRVFARS